MVPFINRVGFRNGRLTVVARAPERAAAMADNVMGTNDAIAMFEDILASLREDADNSPTQDPIPSTH